MIQEHAVILGGSSGIGLDFLPQDQREAAFAEYARNTPVGRIGQPDDVAEAIVYLVTNGFVTGQVLTCDGGLQLAA